MLVILQWNSFIWDLSIKNEKDKSLIRYFQILFKQLEVTEQIKSAQTIFQIAFAFYT